ncbi:transglutaminase-like domain-containing protein [Halococcus sediminicola]|uniref:transglutaminase-like domain-containing protein n=1 Tax=Halococcus sediminicola TaxID=1264579 RepID=UPI00067984A7|nr:transglutaminase-like domain-containing protein [Halococcus sediminicola]
MSVTQSTQRWQGYLNSDLTELASKITSQYGVNPYSPVEHAAAIHYEVNKKVDYEPRFKSSPSREMRSPLETWRVKAGNCQEKSLLTASLLSTIGGFRIRTVVLESDQGNKHRVLEIKIPYHPQDVCETVWNFYKESSCTGSFKDTVGFEQHPEGEYTWLIADSGTKYIGDLSHLERLGYVIEPSEGSWDFYELKEKHELV